jgi:hypothetical protein
MIDRPEMQQTQALLALGLLTDHDQRYLAALRHGKHWDLYRLALRRIAGKTMVTE